ncbi:MAG: penicillin-binding protein [Hoeflea sp.]|uniref:transglycosylase domain-containing protein n=1 Tax=Hoeflea sp. TaxID=1940281 RepID=UPI001D3D67C4|nr:transglycosylase domain-containing protein [Hoeflea sp.]MBU4531712.1 penicillin-binding protein [Alphaproteobacteria bacterium]MBU4544568.1 penicillin-binding protein [Alphaproteobacteria bacterium]MBU4552799.1 penicillin-binding protein [Alphaproteobacteria bacterium]MBV1724988.1 penicillin-binding protein [Hoeflea sp.]MBV1761008.1 penicillin-binding protein [Hoeflea sp.]
MARKTSSPGRIEPSFEGGRSKGSSRTLADERVAGKTTPSKRRNTPQSKARKPKSRTSRGRLSRALRAMVYWSFVLAIWGGIAIAGVAAFYGARMPSASTWSIPDRPPNVKIVSVNGETMANRGATGGEALLLGDMSPYIPEAVIAIEDRRFYSHFGVDPIGLARAMLANVTAGRMVQGGSTLTQQLAKNLFLSPERTLERKVEEVLLAVWLEHKFTKDQILEMYLNRVYFGSGAYGVEAASRRYFRKPASDVSLAEAALLAGLLKAPSRLSPARDPKAAEERAQVVLAAMREQGVVTDREIATALTSPQVRAKSYWTGSENYVADLVMQRLPGLVGTITEDLVVETTIDFELQRQAEKVLRASLDENGAKLNAAQGALISLDGTGAVRALIGGREYATSQFDRATDALRQPGSAFKPFVFTAALEQGRTPLSVRNDAPVRIGKWTPENYDGKYRGEVTLSDALTHSLNTVAAQLVMEVGPKTVVQTAHRLGIEAQLQANASIALGTSEVTLMELTGAYAPFMNGGYKATPHVIRRVSTHDGKVLYENTYNNPPRVIDPAVAAMMNRMLVRVVEEGTGHNARFGGWPAAGKTGTTQSYRDALFVGYTANLVTGVWFGNDDGAPMKKVTGGGLPASTWAQFMQLAHSGLPPANLPLGGPVPPVAIDGPPLDLDAVADLVRDLAPVPVSRDATGATGEGFPVPPAGIGAGSAQPDSSKRTTLLDILMGN